jgi:SAM-dependent methyltransferase
MEIYSDLISMNLFFWAIALLLALTTLGIGLYLITPRSYQSSNVDDAMALSFPDRSFDVVWSIEAGPHMPDKAIFARELMRVLKPGGVLVLADWNQRDDRQKPLNFWEKPVMQRDCFASLR